MKSAPLAGSFCGCPHHTAFSEGTLRAQVQCAIPRFLFSTAGHGVCWGLFLSEHRLVLMELKKLNTSLSTWESSLHTVGHSLAAQCANQCGSCVVTTCRSQKRAIISAQLTSQLTAIRLPKSGHDFVTTCDSGQPILFYTFCKLSLVYGES